MDIHSPSFYCANIISFQIEGRNTFVSYTMLNKNRRPQTLNRQKRVTYPLSKIYSLGPGSAFPESSRRKVLLSYLLAPVCRSSPYPCAFVSAMPVEISAMDKCSDTGDRVGDAIRPRMLFFFAVAQLLLTTLPTTIIILHSFLF